MKKVLIISYYWPPGAGAGVQRWLKFCKYLRAFGWEPVVYTPENPEHPETDLSLAADIPDGMQVVRTRIWEPYSLYKIMTGRPAHEKVQAGFLSEKKRPGKAEQMATWLRGNLFIPDARKWWISPSVRYLSAWLRNNKVDAIVSTGPPHSMHMIALGLKKQTGIPWLADFRDPWTQIDFYHHLMLTGAADRKHREMEQAVLKQADCVVTVSPNCARGLHELSGREIEVVANGFDPDDFGNIPAFEYKEFSITHLGSMNADRNPVALWETLANLVKQDAFFGKHLRIRLIGKTDLTVFESLKVFKLEGFVENLSYLPHNMAIEEAGKSALLLLALNNTPNAAGIAPGKMYEYLALRRPILGIGPTNGDASAILRSTNSGVVLDFTDTEGIKAALLQWKKHFSAKTMGMPDSNIEIYSRKALTQQIALLLDNIV